MLSSPLPSVLVSRGRVDRFNLRELRIIVCPSSDLVLGCCTTHKECKPLLACIHLQAPALLSLDQLAPLPQSCYSLRTKSLYYYVSERRRQSTRSVCVSRNDGHRASHIRGDTFLRTLMAQASGALDVKIAVPCRREQVTVSRT
ncbi:hypothetical protein BV25DRAFT_23703 [Artomyces pyxidatus]|uniref:Uncharacterized protein n=1 Tax=Artomyces pyxidatus TaxID=48021 RepID=A0ACB8TJQ7_9AGAM|nr:hypothetical protein BV25DRAFT_23703 [Artomyces pyxidatus]